MKVIPSAILVCIFLFAFLDATPANKLPADKNPSKSDAIFGFRDAAAENSAESRFLAVPDPKLA